ncbi:hypothetical protein HKBW3S09_00131 [Candidatus Hakubella thermalkaliphila]|uniref:Putative Flp pilus-assembly TadG-like N-terminal domain-containing protein n=2 Tax=Candidatus Hakubella thermalkaliphila TaxID=2754717 RepID=A0A6V8PA99_9ACTN|nr:Tad domain-containing protein [Candidatus Hakubella thermalkaliphila]GFP22663.1 hypothetical protein HKBW3S09_00131 [Candidatus Hakubella thermalkaliphila]GFP29605.1 hypothetical protein HKBW3S34_00525 [Candidatus Hakubella thermalkaliphila]GFP39174.1 hypothetical protein HKBW3S47_00874 [Candidatus Hakubella thermalkaliphila]GFP41318.1 hypothetical protein HKBW3C_00444 [Candidatus Hakubella thermalkaliphila]
MRNENSPMETSLEDEKGTIAIIVALSLVALTMVTALVVDVGSLYQERRFLQTVADSAALAGAQELPESPDGARQRAIEYAAKHGVTITASDVEIGSTLASNDTITVTPFNPSAPLYFARVLGIDSVRIQARAKAIIASPEEYVGVVPWGIPEEDWEPGVEYVLKCPPGPGGCHAKGNFRALRLDGEPGAKEYQENLREGATTPYKVGDVVDTQTGNMRKPTEKGAKERVASDPNPGMQSFLSLVYWDGGGYRLRVLDSQFVMVLLVSPPGPGVSEPVEIRAFVPFMITHIGKHEVKGTFLHEALINYKGPITGVQPGGIRVVRLTE